MTASTAPVVPPSFGAVENVHVGIRRQNVAGFFEGHVGKPSILLRDDRDPRKLQNLLFETAHTGVALLRDLRLERQNRHLRLASKLFLNIFFGRLPRLLAQIVRGAFHIPRRKVGGDRGVVRDHRNPRIRRLLQRRHRSRLAQRRNQHRIHFLPRVRLHQLKLLIRLVVAVPLQKFNMIRRRRILHPQQYQPKKLVLLENDPGHANGLRAAFRFRAGGENDPSGGDERE